MKKCILMIAVAACAAGSAFAQEGNEGAGCPQGKSWNGEGRGKAAWSQHGDQGRGQGDSQAWGQDRRGGGERPGGPMDPAMMEQMKADHKAIRELGDAARAVTNEAAKAEIVAQLRAKIGEVADRMQAHQEQRLAQAEEHLASLKAKIEESKANRDKLIDEQVQRVLSGEKPQRPDAFKQFPHAKGGMMRGDHGDWNRGEMAPPPEAEEADELAPPAEDMPPPPAE